MGCLTLASEAIQESPLTKLMGKLRHSYRQIQSCPKASFSITLHVPRASLRGEASPAT